MATAQITIDQNQEIYPIQTTTIGYNIIDISTFSQNYYFHDLGLKHTSFCESAICYINGENSQLLYRGYPIEALAKNLDFTAIIYLLLEGELPQLKKKAH